MTRHLLKLTLGLAAFSLSFAAAGAVAQPYPVADKAADKVIEKYQTSSCEQLAAKKGQPPSPMAQRAMQLLHQDPAMRTYFINKVAPAIANKLFECGMIP